MAQTVALYRGTTTATSSGGSVTLFTNSASGIATRVILNQLVFYSAGSGNNWTYLYASLLHISSAGPTSLIGHIRNVYSNAGNGLQFYQGMQGDNGLQFASQGTGGSAPATGQYFNQSGAAGAGMNVNPSGIAVNFPQTNSNVANWCVNNFWIGPSDAIAFRFTENTGYSATVGYSFTTITES